ncbi:hypothetical protein B0T10DRAFT_608691 [Thelonectria olida]|uniref:Uncharacterized protein n=1 Tax=Thelonectria olida TaxID=1576542 RepID=A0A9P9ALL0_9HYPO|nr:hypothetical protein B0T10DRAFT_608691 [Thelonectria olida]
MPSSSSRKRRLCDRGSDEREGRVKEGGLACPFYKLNLKRHASCGKPPGFTRICDLRQHLLRVHKRPDHECPTCHQEWDDKQNDLAEAEYKEHILEGKCKQRQASPDDDRLTPDEFIKLGEVYSNGPSDLDKWYWLWKTFFSHHPRPKSPYVEIPGDLFDAVELAIDQWLRSQFNLEDGLDSGSKDLVEAMKQYYRNAPECFRLPVPPVDTGVPTIPNVEQAPSRSMVDDARGPARPGPSLSKTGFMTFGDCQARRGALDSLSQLQSAPDFGTNPESFVFQEFPPSQPLNEPEDPFSTTSLFNFDDPFLHIDFDPITNPIHGFDG